MGYSPRGHKDSDTTEKITLVKEKLPFIDD